MPHCQQRIHALMTAKPGVPGRGREKLQRLQGVAERIIWPGYLSKLAALQPIALIHQALSETSTDLRILTAACLQELCGASLHNQAKFFPAVLIDEDSASWHAGLGYNLAPTGRWRLSAVPGQCSQEAQA